MKIINCGYREAQNYFASGKSANLLVSIADPGRELHFAFLGNEVPHRHVLHFYDDYSDYSGQGVSVAHMVTLRRIFSEFKPEDDSVVVIHCEQGISRSSAATLMFMVEHNLFSTSEEYVAELKNINPKAEPNKWMVDYIANEYDLYDLFSCLIKEYSPGKPNYKTTKLSCSKKKLFRG